MVEFMTFTVQPKVWRIPVFIKVVVLHVLSWTGLAIMESVSIILIQLNAIVLFHLMMESIVKIVSLKGLLVNMYRNIFKVDSNIIDFCVIV